MAKAHRWEAERSAWIKSKRWPTTLKPGAMRRAEILARKARKLDRVADGRKESAFHEGETKSLFHRWTKADSASTVALATVAYGLLMAVGLIYFSLAWAVSWVSFQAWESLGTKHRVLVWPYFIAATVAGATFIAVRHLGLDLWLIYDYASFLETATGGALAPIALSGWYAAGWISWLEAQVVIGLALGGWNAFAWGWVAPAVRVGAETAAVTPGQPTKARKDDDITKIISGGTPRTTKENSHE